MERFPAELADVLTAEGRALLEGQGPDAGVLARQPFYSSTGLIEPSFARVATEILQRAFADLMREMNAGLPKANAAAAADVDVLPKVGRCLSTPQGAQHGDPVWLRAEECGLVSMLTSGTYTRFVAALCGHAIDGPVSMQALCMRPGDYVGPHTDHHPEHADTRDGYTDVHLTFCTPGVEQQLIVYESGGHFSKMVDLARGGTVTAYRLPLWHYTTPMQGAPQARRWLVQSTFVHPARGAAGAR